MRQAINFRLNKEIIILLHSLEDALHTSRTAVVEQALRHYARKKLHAVPTLLEFAGILKEEDATRMLKNIRSNKHNKNIETEL